MCHAWDVSLPSAAVCEWKGNVGVGGLVYRPREDGGPAMRRGPRGDGRPMNRCARGKEEAASR